MKKRLLFPVIASILIAAACTRPGEPGKVLLDCEWKFKTGDDPGWAATSFDDASWGSILPTKIWEQQGFKGYDGIAWYRLKFPLRTALRNQAGASDSIQIKLGRIDDCDQVFLNGELIGENCKTIAPKQAGSADFTKQGDIWNIERRYVLALNDPRIRWDQDNLLAVRCFDHGGAGGMFSKPFEISVTGMADRVTIDFSSPFHLTGDTAVEKRIALINKTGTERYKGELVTEAYQCRTGIRIFRNVETIELTPGDTTSTTVRFACDVTQPALLQVTFTDGLSRKSVNASTDIPYIQTPAVPDSPRINGATVFGVRPWSPFHFQVAATGKQPLSYRATDLPEGLVLNPETGLITGSLKKRGEFPVKITVENSLGYDEQELKIVVGDLISLTPPMGWNSWNCWGLSVSDKKVRQSAEAMKASGLMEHGWSYINIDDGWEDTHDKDGNILPNYKFPNMTALCGYVHSLGLKIGIYSSPGPRTCGGYEGSYGYEAKDAQNYAAWGIDYLKYDWCSYGQIAPDPTPEQLKKPYKEMRHALRKANRDIHYSLCQYGMGDVWTWGAEVDGNSWRTTGDIEDTWESMSSIGFSQAACAPYSAPGRWNDPDMLVVGWVGWGPALHYTRLTPDEQYTHITLWSLLASPLLIGCDLAQLDSFTLNLLTNDEVIAIDQDPLGKQAAPVRVTPDYEVWARDLADGSKAVGLFNKTLKPLSVPVDMDTLHMPGKHEMRDCWRQADLGKVRGHFEMLVRPHGARMVILKSTEKK